MSAIVHHQLDPEPEGPRQNERDAGQDPAHQFLPHQRPVLLRRPPGLRLCQGAARGHGRLGADDRGIPERSPQLRTVVVLLDIGGSPTSGTGA